MKNSCVNYFVYISRNQNTIIMSKFTTKEHIIYGGTCYLLVSVAVLAMVALYEFIENLFNLPV